MNNPHKNAHTCFYSREQIVRRYEAGETAHEIATAFGISVRTVYKWRKRFREHGSFERSQVVDTSRNWGRCVAARRAGAPKNVSLRQIRDCDAGLTDLTPHLRLRNCCSGFPFVFLRQVRLLAAGPAIDLSRFRRGSAIAELR